MATAKNAIPEGHYTLTPIVTYNDCAAAIDFYKVGFGATEVSRAVGPDGKIMHAEIQIGNSRIMMHDVMMEAKGPHEFGGSPVGLWAYVEDCDELFNRAIQAGATVVRPVEDQFWGDRCGTLKDPAGYAWTIATHKEDLTEEEMNARAEEFFKKMAEMAPPQTKAAGAGA
jgi:PhnB protein